MKESFQGPFTILLAEDDPDDRLLTRQAMEKSELGVDLRFVEDGEELVDYLRRRGRFADVRISPRPRLILLDLNMPRKDGREALREIKSDPALRDIPIVILTTSKAEEDIARTYQLGANSFITKPARFSLLVTAMKTLGKYWLGIVQLPHQPRHA